MTNTPPNSINTEDANDVLMVFAKSFNLEFTDNELAHIKTFGELQDHLANKIKLEHSNDCTSQQAFYKLREIIADILQIDKRQITPKTSLYALFPKANRRAQIKRLEQGLGFKLNILTAPSWLIGTLSIAALIAIIVLFFNPLIGLGLLGVSIISSIVAHQIANEFNTKTLGQLAEKMTREYYLKSRRQPNTINPRELEKILYDWFTEHLGLEDHELSKETRFAS